MPGAHQTYQLGPDSRQVSAPVVGGQLVMPDTANPGMVLPATAASTTVLGVALTDAAPYAPPGSQPTPLNLAAFTPNVAVAYGPVDVDLVYIAAAADGQLVVAAANGQVTPLGTGSAAINTTLSAATIVGATTLTTAASVPVGSALTIDTGANQETRTVTALSGTGPYTLTVAALGFAHASGVAATVPAVTGGTHDQVVGRCTQPGGVTAGAAGRCRLGR